MNISTSSSAPHRRPHHDTNPLPAQHLGDRRPFPAASEAVANTDGMRPGPDALAPTTWQGRPLDRPQEDLEDQGLSFDLGILVTRRRTLGALGAGATAAVLAACGAADGSSSGSASDGGGSTASDRGSASAGDVAEMPTETAGPYPGDGSNGADVLEISGVERSDIRSSIDTDTVAEGVPITLTMTVTDLAEDGAAMMGAAVYVWHCDAQGAYSMYSDDLAEETYLRGVQVVGDDGTVTFTSVFPGCYSGRWPHIHFEVFPDLDSVTDATNAVLTSQIALPEDVCTGVYSSAQYDGSAQNLDATSLESDNVFSDGWDMQVPTVTGDVEDGYRMSIDVPIDTSTPEESVGASPGGEGAGGEPPAGGEGNPPADGEGMRPEDGPEDSAADAS